MGEIEPVGQATLEQSVSSLARAFADDPLYVWMLPDPANRSRSLRWLMRSGLDYGRRHGRAFQSDDGLAAAVWLPPGHKTTVMGMIRSGFLAAPFRMGLRPFAKFMQLNSVMERAHKQHASTPHWYLMFIGVAPELQGGGRGSGLVQAGLAQADSAGVPCYLETSNERNLAFYERHGFEIVETATIGNGGPTGWAMRREARGPGHAVADSAPSAGV